jgi:hypothetical protein
VGARKEDIFSLLYEPAIHPTSEHSSQLFDRIYDRFHIRHLGMSSFEKFDVLLLDDRSEQRCLWRAKKDLAIHEAVFPSGTMEEIAARFVAWFGSTPEYLAAGRVPK